MSYNIRNGTYKTRRFILTKKRIRRHSSISSQKEDYKSKSNDSLYKIFKKQSKNKERIDNIREELKNPLYKISKKESKDIKSTLYTIEKTKKISTKKTYLDKLDKRIQELDKYKDYDDYEYKGIKDIEDLFTITIDEDDYKPKLVNSGYKNKYVQYASKGDRILSIKEYFSLIEKYLRELIDEYKNQGEWKLQLTAEIKFISLKPGSDEIRIMHVGSDNEEFMNRDDTDEIIKSLF